MVWQFLIKPDMQLPYDPAIVLLGIHLREMNTYVYTETRKHVFTAVLFIIVPNWK